MGLKTFVYDRQAALSGRWLFFMSDINHLATGKINRRNSS